MDNLTNREIAKMLKELAAALVIKKAPFYQIRAYESAAENIDHSTSEVRDLWQEGTLDSIPGIGESLRSHLEELFNTGKVKHWQEIKKGIPQGFFEFLHIPGVGPKTAWKLTKLGVEDITDLKAKLESNFLIRKGFSEKNAQKILSHLQKKAEKSPERMLLPYAFTQAEKVLNYLKLSPDIKQADVLGSLRRMVSTIGDLDFAISSSKPKEVVEYLTKMPGVIEVIDKGETKVTLLLSSGLHLDFLITSPSSYGALLQHFTGSKSHNIHLRTIAEKKGLSLSEYGVRKLKSQKSNLKTTTKISNLIPTKTEEEFYGLLGMQTPPPEIREDTGEIEAALRQALILSGQAQGKLGGLLKLVELKDIKGDLHIHDNYPIEPSHDLGVNPLEEIVQQARGLGYIYIGIADHSPSISNHSKDEISQLIKRHNNYIDKLNYPGKLPRVLKLLEVDIQPDGALSVPDEGLKLLDFAIASIHSQFNLPKEEMTKRILRALENPYVKVLGHPTGRLINRRSSYDVDWEEVFRFAARNNKALEINAYPDRLDLSDNLVRIAKDYGVKFVIDTDSHIASDMVNMRFGVAVARRGWLTKEDVVNSWDWTRFKEWFKISN